MKRRRIVKMKKFFESIGYTFLILSLAFGTLTIIDRQSAMAQERELKYAHYVTPSYKDLFPVISRFPDYMNEHGKGKVHVKHYHSGSLLQANEVLPGLMQGTTDFIYQIDTLLMGTFPILGIFELPFLYKNVESSRENLKIGSPLAKLINRELAKKNLFMVATNPIIQKYIWTNKPIRVPDDLKGLRMRTGGRLEAEVIKAMGSASVTMPSGDIYEALKRGTIDGTICYEGTIIAQGLRETVKYVTRNDFSPYSLQVYTRLDKWNSFPPDIQKLILDAGNYFEKGMIEYAVPYWEAEIWPLIRKAGIKEIVLTGKELELFKTTTQPVWDWWKGLLPPGVGEEAIRLASQ